MNKLSVEELAFAAGVDSEYLQRLVEVGALEAKRGADSYGPSDVHRVELLQAWEAAGLSPEAVVDLVRAGQISASWLDAPVATQVARMSATYEQVCSEEEVPLALMQSLQEALGFPAPGAQDRTRAGDRELARLIRLLLVAGARQSAILGMVRVYAVGLRRIAKAEAELYESEFEQPLREAGRGEQELLDQGALFMDIASLERGLVDIYRRQREHVWIEHRIAHAERALERAGIQSTVARPPAICFVDLSGYTRTVEEGGDEVAAQLATSLTALVEDISLHHRGRPIRWLGDGGLFYFKSPGGAVLSSLEMVESAPRAGLPPMHIGVHAGPVIFQDGDVYGKTVNLAARIAAHAAAGEVLVSDETVVLIADGQVSFDPLGPVSFKGISAPVTLHRASRTAAG